jgi:acyl-CoA thioesterase FadM
LVTAEGDTIAEGFTLHACVDQAGKVVRLPPDVRALFDRWRPRK